MTRRIAFLWFEQLPMERFARHRSIDGAFALTLHQQNAERIYALNTPARQSGLNVGMGLGDARGICNTLQSAPAETQKDAHFLEALARFSQSYCPWVGMDGSDGLALDITGSAHLWGGEQGFIQKAKADFARLRLTVRIGIASTFGAAWALAHFKESIANDVHTALRDLPVAALRISEAEDILARRLGLHKIADLYDKPRAELTRRFGQKFLLRLDQALGEQFENISPIGAPRIFATRINLPEPIGLVEDVMAGLDRILEPLSQKLSQHGQATQELRLSLRMVDGKYHHITIRFARPMRNGAEMRHLLEPKIAELDAGFGFDLLRVEAKSLMDWSSTHIKSTNSESAFHDLLSKIGNRIGFDNIQRLAPRDSHWPEKASVLQAYDQPIVSLPPNPNPRPLFLFNPERLAIKTHKFPSHFTWRRMKFRTARSIGPERIAPEWWNEDDEWRFGIRDYWRVTTFEGRRLWVFYTPQNPGWYVHGEFV